jgi:hypothetical protein
MEGGVVGHPSQVGLLWLICFRKDLKVQVYGVQRTLGELFLSLGLQPGEVKNCFKVIISTHQVLLWMLAELQLVV